MLHLQANPRQSTVMRALLLIQRLVLSGFDGQPSSCVLILQALIAQVRPTIGAWIKAQRALIGQGFVMNSTRGKRDRENHPTARPNQHLRLERMALFLTAVVTALFFLGRSIGVSVASISTSSSGSPSSSA